MDLETNTVIFHLGSSSKNYPRSLPSVPLQEGLATTLFPQATWGLGRTRNGQRERERGNLPPDSVMRSQFLSSLSRTATRVVQILQRPKWAASQVSLWCSRCGLSKAQWSVTTATMASTPPTRMKKRVTRTFRVLVCDMTLAEVWGLWAGGSSVSQGWVTDSRLAGGGGYGVGEWKLSLVCLAEPEWAGFGTERHWAFGAAAQACHRPEGGFY